MCQIWINPLNSRTINLSTYEYFNLFFELIRFLKDLDFDVEMKKIVHLDAWLKYSSNHFLTVKCKIL